MKFLIISLLLAAHSPSAFSWGGLGQKQHLQKQEYRGDKEPQAVLKKIGDSLLLELGENNQVKSLSIAGRALTTVRRGLIGNQHVSFDVMVDGEKHETVNLRVNRQSNVFYTQVDLKKPIDNSKMKNISLVLAQNTELEVFNVALVD